MKPEVKRALEVAASQLGVREIGNTNRGEEVDAYLLSTGNGPGYPWCAAYVYWCIERMARELRIEVPFLKSAYCPTISNWARGNSILFEKPEPGDVFLLYLPYKGKVTARHTGFVEKVEGGQFVALEGNTNLDGSRDGYGVFRREREFHSKYRYVRWGSLVKPKPTPSVNTYTLMLSGKRLLDMPVVADTSLCPVREWAKALGFVVHWDQENQSVFLAGEVLPADITLVDGVGHAPIRDLVEFSGLRLSVDNVKKQVLVTK